MRSYWPFLVPPLFLALVWFLQPDGRLGPSERAPWLERLFYDDYDPAARALRGLNAFVGRKPGRLDEPPWLGPERFNAELAEPRPADPQTPFFLEYPHVALALFRLGIPDDVSFYGPPDSQILDGDYHDLVEHTPRWRWERALWSGLRRAIRRYAVVGMACLLGLMLLLKQGYIRGQLGGTPVFLLILPAALYFGVHRFDVIPAFLTALSLAALGRGRVVSSALCLGLATMVKVYPILLAPLFLRYTLARGRVGIVWLIAYGASLVALTCPALYAYGLEATWAPVHFQLSRAAEGWTIYEALPECLGQPALAGKLFRNGLLLIGLLMLLRHKPVSLDSLLRRCVLLLLLFVVLSVFYSPQWILWLSPFLVPLAGKNRKLLILTVVFDLIAYLSFPVVFDMPESGFRPWCIAAALNARLAVMALMAWCLIRDEKQGGNLDLGPPMAAVSGSRNA